MHKGRIVLIVLVALVATPDAYALFPEQAVLVGPRNDSLPAAGWNGNQRVLSWARSRPGYPNRYDAWVKVGANARIKLNRRGFGFAGGIDSSMVAYQQVVNGRSNIRLYNLSNGIRRGPPLGVNTRKWEYRPAISGNWLLFGRDDNRGARPRIQRIILHNSMTGGERLLASIRQDRYQLLPGQVNGSDPFGFLATYTRCLGTCDVILYNVSTRSKTTLNKPDTGNDIHQYYPALTPSGTIYVARSGDACGRNVRIVRYRWNGPVGGIGTVVARLPRRRDIGWTSARESANGTVEVFYERVNCITGRYDVFKITDPPGPP
jgi:hypothetical protein